MYSFAAPADWANYRNIDVEVSLDEINKYDDIEIDEVVSDTAKKEEDASPAKKTE